MSVDKTNSVPATTSEPMQLADVAKLTGAALDYAVACVLNIAIERITTVEVDGLLLKRIMPSNCRSWCPSTNWDQGGPLADLYVERWGKATEPVAGWGSSRPQYMAVVLSEFDQDRVMMLGDSLLEAACRAIVASRTGKHVPIPSDLSAAIAAAVSPAASKQEN